VKREYGERDRERERESNGEKKGERERKTVIHRKCVNE